MKEIIPRQIKKLILEDGSCPYEKWIGSLRDLKTRAVIHARLVRVQNGNFGDTDGVGGGVAELRVDFGPGYRIYFGLHGLEIVVLLIGGDKSTQDSDIEKSKALWEKYRHAAERFHDYFERLPES